MALQLDLLGSQPFSLNPSPGLTEPRLWVRRLVLWREPSGEKMQDISFRPGLNIIWSPDLTDGVASRIGHGGGKTLLCRFIRYCLGEAYFADESLRNKIVMAFPKGIVGAEIILDGVCWVVVRSFAPHSRHVATPNANLDDVASRELPSKNIQPLIDAMDEAFFSPSIAQMIRRAPEQKAWPIALAWLTRDQECRFNTLLEWRSPSSESGTPEPASGKEIGPRRNAIRIFINSMSSEENEHRREMRQLKQKIKESGSRTNNLFWLINRLKSEAASALGLSDEAAGETELFINIFKSEINKRRAELCQIPVTDLTTLPEARVRARAAQDEVNILTTKHASESSYLAALDQVLKVYDSEITKLNNKFQDDSNYVCPICEVPIDRVLAEGCKLSHKLPDLEKCRRKIDETKTAIMDINNKLAHKRLLISNIEYDLAGAKSKSEKANKYVEHLEDKDNERTLDLKAVEKLEHDVSKLEKALQEYNEVKHEADQLERKYNSFNEKIDKFIDRSAIPMRDLSGNFNKIINLLLENTAVGSIRFTTNEMKVTVDYGGERHTAAIESLKVLAFDLACLCLSIEGKALVPGFLIHDSPREADLGLSIYHKIFDVIRAMEGTSKTPLFQYIITTTTQPPEDLQSAPWLRLKLAGSPGEARLLKQNL